MPSSNNPASTENVLITAKQRQARMWVRVNVMTLTIDVGKFFPGMKRNGAKSFIIAMEGGIGAWWKAARAGRNFDVTAESGGVSEGVQGLPLECAVRYCQVNATPALPLWRLPCSFGCSTIYVPNCLPSRLILLLTFLTKLDGRINISLLLILSMGSASFA